jgi:hypothetical protein
MKVGMERQKQAKAVIIADWAPIVGRPNAGDFTGRDDRISASFP